MPSSQHGLPVARMAVIGQDAFPCVGIPNGKGDAVNSVRHMACLAGEEEAGRGPDARSAQHKGPILAGVRERLRLGSQFFDARQ